MPDPAAIRALLERDYPRLNAYLRALLPGTDTGPALQEAALRILREAQQAASERFAEWAGRIAGQVAAERRKLITFLPFSDDLFRQLADSARSVLEKYERRPAALGGVLRQLPPPERDLLRRRYELGLTTEQIALAESRAPAEVARDLTALHGSLVTALREAVPDTGPEPSGGAADLGRLADQLLDGPITEDGRLVLETLLLADATAQAHYHRHAALVADLQWHYRGPPPLPEPAALDRPRHISVREWAVTGAFVAAVLAVLGFVVWRLTGDP